jgi:hypothetical protein
MYQPEVEEVDAQKEAQSDADEWASRHVKVATTDDRGGKVVVLVGGTIEAEFCYKPERVAPEKGTLCEFWNDEEMPKYPHIGRFGGIESGTEVRYISMGSITFCPLSFREFSPVTDVHPAGQMQKAVELLELLDLDRCTEALGTGVRQLLDEIKADKGGD